MFTLGGLSFFVFIMRFVVFTSQESPKYLLSKGKDEHAIKVLEKVAKTNRRTINVTMATFEALERNEGQRSSSESSAQTGAERAMIQDGNVIESKALALKPIESIKRELKRVSILFSTPALTRLTILVWVIYAFDYWGFSVAGKRAPISAPDGPTHKPKARSSPQSSPAKTPTSTFPSPKLIAIT
jgi:hypothetical protein